MTKKAVVTKNGSHSFARNAFRWCRSTLDTSLRRRFVFESVLLRSTLAQRSYACLVLLNTFIGIWSRVTVKSHHAGAQIEERDGFRSIFVTHPLGAYRRLGRHTLKLNHMTRHKTAVEELEVLLHHGRRLCGELEYVRTTVDDDSQVEQPTRREQLAEVALITRTRYCGATLKGRRLKPVRRERKEPIREQNNFGTVARRHTKNGPAAG